MKGEVQKVKSVMLDNIEKVIQRGDNIDELVDKSTIFLCFFVRCVWFCEVFSFACPRLTHCRSISALCILARI